MGKTRDPYGLIADPASFDAYDIAEVEWVIDNIPARQRTQDMKDCVKQYERENKQCERGFALMTRKVGLTWYDNVDLRELDLDNGQACIAGQTFAKQAAEDAGGLSGFSWADDHKFFGQRGDTFYGMSGAGQYRQSIWERLIKSAVSADKAAKREARRAAKEAAALKAKRSEAAKKAAATRAARKQQVNA